jgi:hypothetical protein
VKEEEEWEKTTPCPPPHRFRDSFCLFGITNGMKCTSHPCHLKINILFRFQFRDCEGNTLQLYCVPNSEKSHSYMSIERVLRG